MCAKPAHPVTYIVSFPRSGHHGLMALLGDVSTNLTDHYCEFYNCVRHDGVEIPCPRSGIRREKGNFSCSAGKRFMKCHDFDLDLPLLSQNSYVVQYRHPFYSIESWYQLKAGGGRNLQDWTDFFNAKLEFWKRFIRKWVIGTAACDNVLLVPYFRLGQPEFVERVCKFMNLQTNGAAGLPLSYFMPRRQLNHEDPHFAAKEREIRDLLLKAGIPMEFSGP